MLWTRKRIVRGRYQRLWRCLNTRGLCGSCSSCSSSRSSCGCGRRGCSGCSSRSSSSGPCFSTQSRIQVEIVC